MSRSPPAAVSRALRQEAGFGCCVCGNPILQYHHIIDWASEHHFRPQDMMVLCPLHHDQATKSAMPESEQRRWKAEPWNILRGRAKGLLAVRQNYCAANFGSITWVGEGSCLQIDDEDILSFRLDDANLNVSLRLFDREGVLLLEIKNNEWISGDPLPWDIQADWQKLIIREKERRISFSLDATEIPLEVTANFWRNGKYITCSKDGIKAGPISVTLREFALVGLAVSIDSANFSLRTGSEDGRIISWPNRRERLWKAKAEWARLKIERAIKTARTEER